VVVAHASEADGAPAADLGHAHSAIPILVVVPAMEESNESASPLI
jgi:hypothetical protein